MRLSEQMRGGRQHGTGDSGSGSSQQEFGAIRGAVAYQQPIDALHDGRPVTLVATADIAGFSPCEKFIDENGNLDWAPSNEFTVVDTAVRPNTQAYEQQAQKLGQPRR